MRVTILTVGSRGDVQPYIALGRELQVLGYEVRLATGPAWEGLVQAHDLAFAPVRGDVRNLFQTEESQAIIESGNFFRIQRYMMRAGPPLMAEILADSWAACRDSEAIIYSLTGWAGYDIAEKLGVPVVQAAVQPVGPTRAYPFLALPPRLRLGRTFNWLTHLLGEQLFWQVVRKPTNRWRQATLGLPPLPFGGPGGRQRAERMPVLYGYSPTVLPPPRDWPTWRYVTGYWFADPPSDWAPPADLVAFLQAGPPPVYVGFGSMPTRDPAAITTLVLEALARAGRRGVLAAGWGAGLRAGALPDSVFLTDDVPHSWLFPQLAAVVHHGGSGTTAAGLRAGVPSVIVPFNFDQPFWGRRVAALGVGPRPIPQKDLTLDALAGAIKQATRDDVLRRRAAMLGRAIRTESGVVNAAAAFHHHLVTHPARPA